MMDRRSCSVVGFSFAAGLVTLPTADVRSAPSLTFVLCN
jgi:hypothetical protein